MSDAIVTDRLTKYYGDHCALDSLSLRVAQGTVYGLLGRNGAGKTTAIRMLLGMAHPSYGRAELLGEDAAHLRPATRGRIAYLAEGHPLYRWMTVGQAVRFSRAFYERWNQPLVEQILDHFELSPKRRIRRLSRGQQAQVALALAVAADPELLILDDPTLGLDTVVRRDFLESLIQIIQRRGRTILFSSHILGDVERVADRIGILIDGVLRVDCPTDHFKESLRKVVLTFDGDPPELPEIEKLLPSPTLAEGPKPELLPSPESGEGPGVRANPGLVNAQQVGRRWELVMVGFDQEHQKRFEPLHPREIEVLGFNLEDAFIEYTRGRRRNLPVFTTEEEVQHV